MAGNLFHIADETIEGNALERDLEPFSFCDFADVLGGVPTDERFVTSVTNEIREAYRLQKRAIRDWHPVPADDWRLGALIEWYASQGAATPGVLCSTLEYALGIEAHVIGHCQACVAALYQARSEVVGPTMTTAEIAQAVGISERSLYAHKRLPEYRSPRPEMLTVSPPNFVQRIGELRGVASTYFVKHCDQNREGEFAEILKTVIGYSARRNDVAHGVVRLIHVVRDPEATLLNGVGPPQWCLVPPDHRAAKFISPGVPARVLTSREINGFTRAFWPIFRRVHAFALILELPRHAMERSNAIPPPWRPNLDPLS